MHNRQFEFSKEDALFTMTHSQLFIQLGFTLDQQDSTAFKKKLKEIAPANLPNCFCCGKDIPTSGGSKK